jgi:hypothetical protein
VAGQIKGTVRVVRANKLSHEISTYPVVFARYHGTIRLD